MENRKVAVKADWQTEDMPSKHAKYTIKRHFTHQQMECLKFGHIPEEMEDKWFWYMDGQKLYAHRSWTGICIYVLTFDEGSDIIKVTANRDPEQYSCTDDAEDAEILNNLLDWWVQENYDYYNEWLSETADAINKQKYAVKKDVLLIDGRKTEAVYFHKPDEPNGFLSNWWKSDFTLEGRKYTSAEQYIMYRKCMMFGDTESADRVLATDDTKEQQDIARHASGYNDRVWSGTRQAVLMRALVEKFAQNDDLREALASTGDAYLVECAYSDKIWACGQGLDSTGRLDIAQWTGKNILGFALMEVRRMLCGGEISEAPRSNICLNLGDITKLDVECIVNAANRSLLGGGGVDGAIHRAAGPELLAECRTLNGCNFGEAKITRGYNLKAKWIIHTVGPIYSGSALDAELLSDCYRNSLDLAKRTGIKSIAFPGISTGVYGYPKKAAAKVAVSTVNQWIADNKDYEMKVVFCCYDKESYGIYKGMLGEEIGCGKLSHRETS